MADPVAQTAEQKLALARQILGVVGGVVDLPPHLKLVGATIAEQILVTALSDENAQAVIARVERVAGPALALFAALKG